MYELISGTFDITYDCEKHEIMRPSQVHVSYYSDRGGGGAGRAIALPLFLPGLIFFGLQMNFTT